MTSGIFRALMKLLIVCPRKAHCGILRLPGPIVGPQGNSMGLPETQNISVWESLDLRNRPYTTETTDFFPGQTHWSILGLPELSLGPQETPMGSSGTQNISARESLDLRDPPYTYETACLLPRADPLEHAQSPGTLLGASDEPHGAVGDTKQKCTGEPGSQGPSVHL